MSREIVIPSKTLQEEITQIIHYPGEKIEITVQAGRYINNKFKAEMFVQTLCVSDTDYAELLSANPSWSPNKPAGVFRIDDLWHYIDKYRAV